MIKLFIEKPITFRVDLENMAQSLLLARATDAEKHAQSVAPFTDAKGTEFDMGAKGYKQLAKAHSDTAEEFANKTEELWENYWVGTQEEYDNILEYDQDRFYFIIND